MNPKISEPVSVALFFDHEKRKLKVEKVFWKKRFYEIEKQGLHHSYKRGSNTIHIFAVATSTVNFRLLFDSSSLLWTLDEVYDSNFR